MDSRPILICVGLDQKTANAGLDEVLDYFFWSCDAPKNVFEGIKVVVATESMWNQTLMDITEETYTFSLTNLFRKDSPPMSNMDQRVIISGIGQEFVGSITVKFQKGVDEYINSK